MYNEWLADFEDGFSRTTAPNYRPQSTIQFCSCARYARLSSEILQIKQWT